MTPRTYRTLIVTGSLVASLVSVPPVVGADVQVTVGEDSTINGGKASDDFTGPVQIVPNRADEGSSTSEGSVGDLLRLVGLQLSVATPTDIARTVTFVMGIVTQLALFVGNFARQPEGEKA